MTDVAALDHELNEMILQGAALDAFEKFYADDCTMQENKNPPRVGKAVNREFEQQFFAAVERVNELRLLSTAVADARTFSEWVFDLTFKDGTRKSQHQVAVRQWKGGQVTSERFYYDPT